MSEKSKPSRLSALFEFGLYHCNPLFQVGHFSVLGKVVPLKASRGAVQAFQACKPELFQPRSSKWEVEVVLSTVPISVVEVMEE